MDEISLWLYGVRASPSPKPNSSIVCPERGGALTWVPVVLCVVRESCCLKGALRMPRDHSPFHNCSSVSWPWTGFFFDLGGIWVVKGLGLDDKCLSWKDRRPDSGKTKEGAKSHCSIETSWLLLPGWRTQTAEFIQGLCTGPLMSLTVLSTVCLLVVFLPVVCAALSLGRAAAILHTLLLSHRPPSSNSPKAPLSKVGNLGTWLVVRSRKRLRR